MCVSRMLRCWSDNALEDLKGATLSGFWRGPTGMLCPTKKTSSVSAFEEVEMERKGAIVQSALTHPDGAICLWPANPSEWAWSSLIARHNQNPYWLVLDSRTEDSQLSRDWETCIDSIRWTHENIGSQNCVRPGADASSAEHKSPGIHTKLQFIDIIKKAASWREFYTCKWFRIIILIVGRRLKFEIHEYFSSMDLT